MQRRSLVLAGLLLPWSAGAHDYLTPNFRIVHPWAMPSAASDTSAGVFLHFDEITADDSLIGAHSSAADKVEIRRADKTLKAVDLPAGKRVDLNPWGTHLMLVGLKGPLELGRTYPLTFVFKSSAEIRTQISVGGH